MSDSRNQILNRIQTALKQPHQTFEPARPDADTLKALNLNQQSPDELWLRFQKELELIAGEYRPVSDRSVFTTLFSELTANKPQSAIALCSETLNHWVPELQAIPSIRAWTLAPAEKKKVLSTVPIAVTPASYAIAELGSVAILYDEVPETLPIFLADSVVVVVKHDHIVANLHQLFSRLAAANMSNMILVTGPSRTADIEKVLVLGAHGPHRLIVCRID